MTEWDMAREVADNIYADSQSGSAAWDEVHGPDSERRTEGDKHVILIPEGWDDSNDDPEDQDDPDNSKRWCKITVEMLDGKPE